MNKIKFNKEYQIQQGISNYRMKIRINRLHCNENHTKLISKVSFKFIQVLRDILDFMNIISFSNNCSPPKKKLKWLYSIYGKLKIQSINLAARN